jgi:Flp pilus assembly protein TadB
MLLVASLVFVAALGAAFAVSFWQTRRDRREGLTEDPFAESRRRFKDR